MKTPKQIIELNYNDVAFFTEKTTGEAKWNMAHYFYDSEKKIEENLTDSGMPKLKITDLVLKSEFETKIKSSSNLEGKNKIDYTIQSYNNGIPLDALRKFSETVKFQKALRFTGKQSILNDILNEDQLLKVQKSWLLKNTYDIKYWSKNCVKFIENNIWAYGFLLSNNISEDTIKLEIERLDNLK